jgi:2-methylcitrate dehydratase PrpD
MTATAAPGRAGSLELAAFMAGLRFADIPGDVISHMKTCLLDTLGCGLFGSTLPWTEIAYRAISVADPGGDAGVWGTGESLSAPHAALINGSAVHAFELDDLHATSIVHPGSVVAPAAFAAASLRPGTSGANVLTAVVAGYETAARVGMTMGAAHLLAGWHPTGTHGTLGAAAAAGSVLGLDESQMRNALGCAGSMSAGLMAAQYESMVKRLHAGRAAQSGLYSALLAANGYVGIADLFEADYGGYCTTFSPAHDLTPLTADLGTVWQAGLVGFKPYSCNGSCHPTVDILREMVAGGLSAPDVSRVDVHVSTATVKHVGWDYVPGSITTAQMNLPYIAAAVLTDGDAFVDQFTPRRVTDQALVDLSRQVHVHADPGIDALGDKARHMTRLTVTRRDGSTVSGSRDFAHGSSRDPLTTDDVRGKYRRLAAKALPPERAGQLAAVIGRLEQLDDLRELTSLLASQEHRGEAVL